MQRIPDRIFLTSMAGIGALYALLIGAMLLADATYTTPDVILEALSRREIRYSIMLSFVTCTISAVLSVWIAVPTGYVLSRCRFPGKRLVDALFDIPIVLPPLVVGLSLLILFQTGPGRFVERFVDITYAIPSVIIAQTTVAAAFAVRTMRVTFDQIDPRREQVALTLGFGRAGAFFRVGLPEAWRGVVAAAALAWARALGEFGPILVFSGATRMRTEVLPSTVFLELSVGDIEAALAVSLMMVVMAIAVMLLMRLASQGGPDRT